MLARITGLLETLEGNTALIVQDLGGGGAAYEVLLPAYLARTLEPQVGSGVTLITIQYLESLNQGSSFVPRLIGFGSIRERGFFELLTTVKGLGNKRALRAMVLEPGSIARSIYDRDARALQRLPEIGPKLAELIIHELKNKVDAFVQLAAAAPVSVDAAVEPKTVKKPRVRLGEAVVSVGGNGAKPQAQAAAVVTPPIRQTVETLITLGEAPPEAERIVSKAIEQARAAGRVAPGNVSELLAAAYAAR